MTSLRYTPGEWCAIVAPSGLAVLPAHVEASMLESLWEALSEGAGLGAVLESLSGAFGTSLSAIPPFAVATLAGDSVRLAVRGGLAIAVTDASGSYEVSGADVTTWSERVVTGGIRLQLRVESASVSSGATDGVSESQVTDAADAADAAAGPWFPIASGVVLCAAVDVRLTADAAPAAAAPAAAAPTAAAPVASQVERRETASVSSGAPDGVSESHVTDAVEASLEETVIPAAVEETVIPAGIDETVIPESTVLPEAPAPAPAAAAAADAASVSSDRETPHEAPKVTDADLAAAASDETGHDATGTDATGHDATRTDATGMDATGRDASGHEAPGPDAAASDETGLDDELVHTRTELPDDAYDHLWGATVVKSVEQAAVREVEDDEDEASVTPAAAPVVTPAPEEAAEEQSAAAGSGIAAPGFAPAAVAAPPAPPVSGGLIDGVPDFGGLGAASGSASINGRTVPPITPPAPPAPAAAASATPAAAAASASAPAVGPAATGADFDHDGLTVTVSELDAMRRLGGASGADPAAADAPVAPPAGGLGRILLSTGETYALDRPIIIGRRPRANRVQAHQVPVLVTVASPEQDISRNHLEIRIEGRHVLVVDLDTTNGSVLHREGTPPLRLGPNEPVLVLSDDVVDLGDGITVAFEDVP